MGFVAVAVAFEDSWYFDSVVAGIGRPLRVEGHEIVVHLVPYGPDARETVTALLDADLQQPDCVGAVAVTFRLEPARAARLTAHGKPVVIAGGASAGLPAVHIDDEHAARTATEHLLALGHTSIAHLGGYTIGPDDSTMRSDRVRGYSEAMHAAGLDDLSRVHPSDFGRDAAYLAAKRLLAEDRPTAVFAVSDEVALAVLDAAKDRGIRVPGELSVVGIDDDPRSAAAGLTTVRQDPGALGAAAAELLLRGVRGVHDEVLEVTLVPRASTAAPGARGLRGPSFLGRLLKRRAPTA